MHIYSLTQICASGRDVDHLKPHCLDLIYNGSQLKHLISIKYQQWWLSEWIVHIHSFNTMVIPMSSFASSIHAFSWQTYFLRQVSQKFSRCNASMRLTFEDKKQCHHVARCRDSSSRCGMLCVTCFLSCLDCCGTLDIKHIALMIQK